MHTPGAHVSKSMHPADKIRTQGAGCTLNFEHQLTKGRMIYARIRKKLAPGSLHCSFRKVVIDLLCVVSHRRGVTHPAFDDPVGSTG